MGMCPNFFQIFLSLFNRLSINTNEFLEDYFFNFNPLNGHYLNPHFSPNTMTKEEKNAPFKGLNKFFAEEQFMETIFLGHVRV